MSDIKIVAVCGAGGTMGAGIAMVAARAGFRTICFDQSAEGLSRSRRSADKFFAGAVAKGRMTQEAYQRRWHA
jgi:3-hydroxybutyryl-CoA dehydrogenase